MLYIFEYRVGKTKRQREDDLEKSRTRHIIPKKPPLGKFNHPSSPFLLILFNYITKIKSHQLIKKNTINFKY